MLNELFAIRQSLVANGAAFGARHPSVKDMARADVIRVRLSESGALEKLELIPAAERGALWTLRDGQQNGFPGLKTNAGLLDLDETGRSRHGSIWRTASSATDRRTELLRLVSEGPWQSDARTWPKENHRRKIAERLELLRPLATDPRTAAVPAAFERFLRALGLDLPFLTALGDALATKIRDGDESWLEPTREALVGPVALAIDVGHDPSRFERDTGDARQIEPVSASLGRQDQGAWGNGNPCAFTGVPTQLLKGNFPQPNLPTLGQTYIFSRNRDIPAMVRYDHTSTGSMPIGADLAAELSAVILSLTINDRRGKTWRPIPAERGDNSDLLIASLVLDFEVRLADALATEEDDTDWGTIEFVGASALGHLVGKIETAAPLSEVRLLVLRTIDPANRKAVYDRRISVIELHRSAVRWNEAMHNTPDWLTLPVAVKNRVVPRGPPVATPLSLVRLSRTLFANGGRRRVDVIGVAAADALGLFLGDGDLNARARRMLALVLHRHQTLLISLAQLTRIGGRRLKEFDPKTDLRRDTLRSASWMGALLYSLDRCKEIYMSDTAFRLGQLLAAADAVHIGYCADVRKGDTPPTLLGNSVFAIAGRHPVRALEILCGRWKPYGAWASRQSQIYQRASDLMRQGEESRGMAMRRGVRCAREAGILSEELRGPLAIDPSVDERFRAELLLGYLAGIKPASKQDGVEASDNADSKTTDDGYGEGI